MILCSDGYLLTVMKLEEAYSLTSLVVSLVNASKTKLSQYHEMRGNLESSIEEKKMKKSSSSVSLHDSHPKAFLDISNFSDLAQTTQSRLHSTSKYSVHFAGIDSPHETSLKSDPLNHILSQVTAAFCLLLNSEVLLPHSGMFPYNGTIDSVKMSNIYSDTVKAGDMVITTLLGIDELSSCGLKSSFPTSYLTSVVLKILELMPLDTNCSHYGLFSKLISAFLQLYFTELHDVIDHLSAILKYNYNDKVNFIKSYCCRISTTANLLHYIIELVNHTYNMSPFMSYCTEVSTVASFASFSFLTSSFQFLVKDVYIFINLLKNIFAQNQPKVLDYVKKCIRTSLEVLKFAKHWLAYLTGTKLPSKKLIQGNYIKCCIYKYVINTIVIFRHRPVHVGRSTESFSSF